MSASAVQTRTERTKQLKQVLIATTITSFSLLGFYLLYRKWSHTVRIDKSAQKFHAITKNEAMQIIYVYDYNDCENVCRTLLSERPYLLGLDCEWRPNRHKTEHNKLAVIQLCSSTQCIIIQCIEWEELPHSLVRLLTANHILKTGIGIHGDSKVIRRSFGVTLQGYFDIRHLAVVLHEKNVLIPRHCFGLKKLTLHLFGVQIPTECTRTDWQQRPLSEEQILYGCLDCYYSRMTTLVLAHCLLHKRIIHHGTDDIARILREMDTADQVKRLVVDPHAYMFNQPFRQPSWLCTANQSSKSANSTLSLDSSTISSSSVSNLNELAKLEEKWLGLHVEKYQKKRKRLEYWNMFGSDGKFVAKVKKKRVIWYMERNLAVVIDEKPEEQGQLPEFQLVFKLTQYNFPGEGAYVMKACFVCKQRGDDGKHMFKHAIFPKCYRKWISQELLTVLSHELIPLCGVCKQRAETANVAYRKELEQTTYAHYNPTTPQIKKISRAASALLGRSRACHGQQLPDDRRNELLQRIAEYYKETDVANITHAIIFEAANLWTDKTFGEILMDKLSKKPEELFSFIVGWKQHFVDTLKPQNLKPNWMENGNQILREILGIPNVEVES